MTLADGTVYIGEYSEGLKEGKGKVIHPDGTSMEGLFTNDLCDGPFNEYDANGDFVKTVNYVNGMRR